MNGGLRFIGIERREEDYGGGGGLRSIGVG